MKKNILLIQLRGNDLVAENEKSCLVKAVGNKAIIKTYNFFRSNSNLSKKSLKNISGIIIGGSGEFSFSEKEKKPSLFRKVKKAILFIKVAIDENIPILGICLGHQLLAYNFGSKIIKDNSQKEVGAVDIFLSKEGRKDAIFLGIPSVFLAQEGHGDCALNLPKKAVFLAESRKCRIQAFRIKNNIYGVQFHPELNSKKDILLRAKIYSNYNINVDKMDLRTSSFGKKIINNFVVLIIK
jgi:GMP synthase (glutamine-hydrolysing)